MKILSHRGYWTEKVAKNSVDAFEKSFSRGFGTETDIRDYAGKLVISHDIADQNAIDLDIFFEIYKKNSDSLSLALNIKADGLQALLKSALSRHNVKNYFVFDMAVPDALGYLKHQLNVFTRQSEFELAPPFYAAATGVWMDEFHSHWITKDIISSHLSNNKKICIVSPELHGRQFELEWSDLKKIERDLGISSLMLCTDYPEQATEFFGE